MPWRTSPPFCMRLLTSKMCPPPRAGKSEVRNAKPLISPLTRNCPRVPQTLATSKGMRIMVHPRRDWMRSSGARNVFGIGLTLPFTAHTSQAILLLSAELIFLRSSDCGHACSFFEGANGVDPNVFEFLKESAGPAYLHPIDFGGRAQAEVHAHVVVGIETGAAASLIDERARAGPNSDARADSITIRLSADRAKRPPV